jgi:formate/nitrite transporter
MAPPADPPPSPVPAANPFDAYAPAEIARRVEAQGVAKARLPALPVFVLALLGGAFIAFGAMAYTLVMTGNDLGFGPGRLLGGFSFALGLILVVVAGAELFTGNNLIVIAWAERRITTAQLLRNWGIVYAGNLAGAVGSALLVHWSGAHELGGHAVGETARGIAHAKLALDPAQAFFRGLLCNALVCLAVWLAYAARDVAGKILAILFTIAAFVALGFEHSVANMYFIPVGMLLGAEGATAAALLANLVPVTAGNIIGGSVFVALTYWLVYIRARR